ncbi:pyocin knob domain-containing protein (plasmid) [Thioclava sp. 'Guangxiensis']|uniref:pyocin knob domain-containing protein n=1 Tax=Thioclava sp. 'Guangxiensis' TaxID=3149044 RepID=UPI0032C42752
MAKPTYTPPPNEAPILGDPSFAAKAQGFLGWFPVMGEYMQGMGEWIETMIGDVPSDNIAAFAHLGGAANKLPYFTGAGAMAMADLTADGRSLIGQSGVLKASGALLAGTGVTQSNYDTTANRLLKVGDAGILGKAYNANGLSSSFNCDDAPSGMWMSISPSATNSPYVGGSGMAGFLYTLEWNTGVKTQTFIATSPASVAGREYRRSYDGSAWSAWSVVYGGDSAITSSTADGVQPLFQRGSNSNGEYVRFVDGTQICWRRSSHSGYTWTTADGALFMQGSSSNWTFPAAFSAIPSVSGAAETAAASITGVAFGTATTTVVPFRPWSSTSLSGSVEKYVHTCAVGRWK